MNTSATREDEFEQMDASIFTGDVLYTDFSMVKKYVERWSRAVKNHERQKAEELEPERLLERIELLKARVKALKRGEK